MQGGSEAFLNDNKISNLGFRDLQIASFPLKSGYQVNGQYNNEELFSIFVTIYQYFFAVSYIKITKGEDYGSMQSQQFIP